MVNYADLEDLQLVRRVALRDRRAFFELYDRHARRVYGLARRMTGEAMAAEEVAQEAFLRLWLRAETYREGRGSFPAWLLTITRRIALDRIRSQGRRPDLAGASDPESVWEAIADPRSQTTEARWGSLRFALADLPAEQRIVLEMAFYHGLTHSEIQHVLGVPLGTVKTRLRLAVQKLRRAIGPESDQASRRSDPAHGGVEGD